MKGPFCENKMCDHNKFLVEPRESRITVEKSNVRSYILRHVYAQPNGQPGEVIFLCGVCHNAIKIVC